MNHLIFQNSFDATNTSRGRFLFLDFEFTKHTSMFDVGSTAQFAGDGMFKITNRINLDDIWIFLPELTMSMQGIPSICFFEFGKGDSVIFENPLVNLSFESLNFFRS